MTKRGRPVSDDPRNMRVMVRMTGDEYEELDRLSKSNGVNMADYIRKQIGMYDPSKSKKTRR